MAKKILIAEDEPNIVISLEFLLQAAGYDTSVARDGNDALQKLDDYEPDLILLDIMLPLRNGFEVCQRIRENPARRSVKIVMITAKGRDVEVTKGLALGADAYITKPFATKELLANIKRLLGE